MPDLVMAWIPLRTGPAGQQCDLPRPHWVRTDRVPGDHVTVHIVVVVLPPSSQVARLVTHRSPQRNKLTSVTAGPEGAQRTHANTVPATYNLPECLLPAGPLAFPAGARQDHPYRDYPER
jgi:hypothetical protein